MNKRFADNPYYITDDIRKNVQEHLLSDNNDIDLSLFAKHELIHVINEKLIYLCNNKTWPQVRDFIEKYKMYIFASYKNNAIINTLMLKFPSNYINYVHMLHKIESMILSDIINIVKFVPYIGINNTNHYCFDITQIVHCMNKKELIETCTCLLITNNLFGLDIILKMWTQRNIIDIDVVIGIILVTGIYGHMNLFNTYFTLFLKHAKKNPSNYEYIPYIVSNLAVGSCHSFQSFLNNISYNWLVNINNNKYPLFDKAINYPRGIIPYLLELTGMSENSVKINAVIDFIRPYICPLGPDYKTSIIIACSMNHEKAAMFLLMYYQLSNGQDHVLLEHLKNSKNYEIYSDVITMLAIIQEVDLNKM